MHVAEPAPGTVIPSDSESGTGATDTRLATGLLMSVRPFHWVKNLLVVPVSLVDPSLWSMAAIGPVLWSVVAFCLAAALIYLGNDLADQRRDRSHPVKRHRPIASGRVSVPVAVAFGTVLTALLGVVVVAGLDGRAWPVAVYLGLNVVYSGGLKHLPLLDVSTVSTGFVLRVVQGYVATGGAVPGWLLLAVFCGALHFLIGKRRRELADADVRHRPALRGYSVELTDHLLHLTSALFVVAGLLHLRTEDPFTAYGQAPMLVSAPFLIFVVCRHLQSVVLRRACGDPVRALLGDRALLVAVLLWAFALATTMTIAHRSAGW